MARPPSARAPLRPQVDKVKEYVPGEYAIGIKNVTINDNFFPGHFPDRPIMPGVLQVEAMAQVGGIVMLDADPDAKGSFFFGGVDKCRFRKPVVPGDTLEMKVTLTSMRKRFGIAKMHGEAYVDGELVCDVDMMLVYVRSAAPVLTAADAPRATCARFAIRHRVCVLADTPTTPTRSHACARRLRW